MLCCLVETVSCFNQSLWDQQELHLLNRACHLLWRLVNCAVETFAGLVDALLQPICMSQERRSQPQHTCSIMVSHDTEGGTKVALEHNCSLSSPLHMYDKLSQPISSQKLTASLLEVGICTVRSRRRTLFKLVCSILSSRRAAIDCILERVSASINPVL